MQGERVLARLKSLLQIAAPIVIMAHIFSCGDNYRAANPIIQHERSQPVIAALSQLDALPKPEGVDAKLWDELKDALKKALETEGRGFIPRRDASGKIPYGGEKFPALQKNTSTPPTGDANHVADFAITDHGDGSYSLSWHYRNLGDYDQNGVVGVSDITPLAMHFGETYNPELEQNTIQAVVDGDASGKVGIEDVTQIAMYFGTSCAGYSLRASDILPTFVSDTDELDVIPLSFAQGEGRYEFGVEHALPSHSYIAVAPVDSEGAFGVLSNIVQTLNHIPVAALTVDPQQGDAPLTVGLDAGDSTDVDGPIAKFEWDFEGDGVWDEDSGTLSYVEHVYEAPDFYYPVVRVTDDEGATSTAEASVFAGQWRITTVAANLSNQPESPNLIVVNGYPAMSFYARLSGVDDSGYYYVRATSSLGQTWGDPVLAFHSDAEGTGAQDDCLLIVNGKPAIAAPNNHRYGEVYYVQANDTEGSTWGTALQVCWGGPVVNPVSMAIVNGKPAIAQNGGRLYYARAQDADGTAWNDRLEVAWDGSQPSLAAVEGFPAISFADSSSGLCYVRANDQNGDTWGEPVIVDALDGDEPRAESYLSIVNGNPAICHNDAVDGVEYVRALDAEGSAWGAPVIVTPDGWIGNGQSLAIINGRPTIAYERISDHALMYSQAKDSEGLGWRPPVAFGGEILRLNNACISEINGHPAIGYIYNYGGDLKFAIYY
jgi:PKD repeat protein